MKKLICILLATVFILSLCACSFNFKDDPSPVHHGTFDAKIVDIRENSLLVIPWDAEGGVSEDAGLYFATPDSLEGLDVGDSVTIAYSGEIFETYPAQLGGVKSIEVTGHPGDLAGLFVDVFLSLWEAEPELNDGVELLAFDLSQCSNLSAAEKAAVMYLLGMELGIPDQISGTQDELIEDGYIDKESQYLENGVIFSVYKTAFEDGSFTFSASKWRGVHDAVGYNGCSAEYDGSEWRWTQGDSWAA